MGELKTRPSKQSVLPTDDANSLTSFPELETPVSVSTPHPGLKAQNEQLYTLLDGEGPSFFDEQQNRLPEDPQTLSAAPIEHLQQAIDHHGAVELVRHLSCLLAERDAHITALTRLAEEYNAPQDKIADTASRVKRAERRRLSLAAASEQLMVSRNATRTPSTHEPSIAESSNSGAGTMRGITKLFGGGGKRPSLPQPAPFESRSPRRTSVSSRSTSQQPQPKRSGRPMSIDNASVTSNESGGWTTSIMSLAGSHSNKKAAAKPPVELNTRHDPDQLPPTLTRLNTDPQSAEWNRYITRLAEIREQRGEASESGCLIGAATFGNEGNIGRQKMERLTKLVLGGIPMPMRQLIWMELSNTYAIMTPDVYERHLSSKGSGDTSQIDAVLKDVPRTLTDSYDFYANKGFERLRDVLIAFVEKYYELGYTQGLNYIAGYLLLAIPSEEDAFWLLCNMVDNFFPEKYFAPETSMCGALADNIVLRTYLRELMPHLAKHLDDLGVQPDHTVPIGWHLTAFANKLPPKVLLRVWDVMLCLPNQHTFVFNVALALLAQHQEEILECETDSAYYAYTWPVAENGAKTNELIRQAFTYRKKLERVGERRRNEVRRVIREREAGMTVTSPSSERDTKDLVLEAGGTTATRQPRKSASTEALFPEDER